MKRLLALVPLLLLPGAALGQSQTPQLLQKPTVNKTHIVFSFADDLWIVPRAGGDAQRLTTGPGVETDPIFSPDGQSIAFTGEYEGNVDVYVMPASGGEPRRLTYHPGADTAVGWTPDGKGILFRSGRNSYSRFNRLFTVPVEGGFCTEVPLPMADQGCYSADGKRMAYVPLGLQSYAAWKRYRGGTASAVWIADLADSSVVKIPRDKSNDAYPMWIGERIYFLSDRQGPTTLYCYDLADRQVRQVVSNNGLDLKSASAGPDCIVYEQFGSIHVFNPKTETASKVDIRVHADIPALRPKFVKAGKQMQSAGLSPTGVRAVFEAHGEIVTVPTKKGDYRNLTNTPAVCERDPAWSPDGKWIAYFSDASGEYELHLRDQSSLGTVKKFTLGDAPAFYYSPRWSPDSKKIAYTDNRAKLWFIDFDAGTNTLVATNTYAAGRDMEPSWSPDSKWLAYSKFLKNHLHAVFAHNLASGKSTQITDGMSDAIHPQFDRGGKYLFFTASTDAGPAMGGIEMSNFNYPVTRSVYLAVLDKTLPSPLAPESDEEKGGGKKVGKKLAEDGKLTAPVTVKIDFEDIGQRIIALPIPARNYMDMQAGKAGSLFLLEAPITAVGAGPGGRGGFGKLTLHKFDLGKRKLENFADIGSRPVLSADGEKLMYRTGDKWMVVSTGAGGKGGEMMGMLGKGGAGGGDALKTDDIEVRVDPRAEWKQMYHEVWRIERDFLYDPHYHGYDLKSAERNFQPYLEGVASRRDLNYLFMQMLSELTLGHVYVRGGDLPDVKHVKGGLLGADYTVDQGRYRFAKVYHGENWNPGLRAPLTEPGVNVKANDYLLAVNGQDVQAPADLYRYFEGTAGKSIVLRVGPTADGKGARDVTVVPIESEVALRNRAWIEDNRRKVDKLTGGKIAYVYLPDTAVGGYTYFNRYFFAQTDKQGVVIDERFNGGGKAADYIVERLQRPLANYWSTRWGVEKDYTTPAGAIFGPKAMIINEFAGSGGDYLPWAFRRAKLGPLVGKRTWGGLVGIGGYPVLMDGGTVTAPHFAFWTPEGRWEVENNGVAPDVEIEMDPKLWRQGRDPQLEKAVQLVMTELERNPPTRAKRPPYPDYHRKITPAGGGQGGSR